MAEKKTDPQKKKYKYIIETTEPLKDGEQYLITFADKRVKAEPTVGEE